MKKIIPYLLLFGLLYGAWYYWQLRPKPPLVAQLLPYTADQVDRILVTPGVGKPFELSATSSGWIVEGQNRSIQHEGEKANQLLTALLQMRSSGLANDIHLEEEQLSIRLSGADLEEHLHFFAPPDSFPDRSWLLSINGLKDVYLVEDFPLLKLPVRFADYRNRLLLDLSQQERLDSLVWWSVADSSRNKLLDAAQGDSLILDSLKTAWSPWLENQFADFFGEIRHANTKLGHFLLYQQQDSLPQHLDVYANEGWERPYVLKGSGPEYFALDSLFFTVDYRSSKAVD